jgi:zinc protease
VQRQSITRQTLDNGLQVAVRAIPSTPAVGIALYYDVGSKDEVPGRSGFAHLFEHLMFQGSARAAKGEHMRLIQSWGGELNGSTSQDRTNFYAALPASQLALGLWLEADRMQALDLSAENFENQRQTVMEERKQVIDDQPYGLAGLRLAELSHTSWAYAHPVIGTFEDLEAARFEEAVDFHRAWYRPDNATLGIAGDIDPDEALALVAEYFGDITAQPMPRPARGSLAEPARTAPRVETIHDPLAQLPGVFINHLVPPCTHPDFFVYELIETILFRGPSSRLHRRMVIEDPVALQIGGGHDPRRGPGLFSLTAISSTGLDPVVAAYFEELERLAEQPPSAAELTRAHNQLRAAWLFAQESPLAMAMSLGRAMVFYGDPEWDEGYLSAISAVTAEDVQRVVTTGLSPDARVELRVLPGAEG